MSLAQLTLTPTRTVTEIWGHCGEGGKEWGLCSTLLVIFSKYMNIVSRKLFFLSESKLKKKYPKFSQTHFPTCWNIPQKKCKILSNSSFPFPFPRSLQKNEWIISQFSFPQDSINHLKFKEIVNAAAQPRSCAELLFKIFGTSEKVVCTGGLLCSDLYQEKGHRSAKTHFCMDFGVQYYLEPYTVSNPFLWSAIIVTVRSCCGQDIFCSCMH